MLSASLNKTFPSFATFQAGIIERVDAIYRSTVWNSAGLTGLGFQIQQVGKLIQVTIN